MSEMTVVENLGKITDIPQLPADVIANQMNRNDPALVSYGIYEGDDPHVQRLIGMPGLLAPGDHVEVQRFILPDGKNVRPFRPQKPDRVHYIFPVDGEVIVRIGNSRQRRIGHTVLAGELLRVAGSSKRSIESPKGEKARGLLFDVDSTMFDLLAFAEPHFHSAVDLRQTAARWLISEVEDGKRSPVSARDKIEGWYRKDSALDS